MSDIRMMSFLFTFFPIALAYSLIYRFLSPKIVLLHLGLALLLPIIAVSWLTFALGIFINPTLAAAIIGGSIGVLVLLWGWRVRSKFGQIATTLRTQLTPAIGKRTHWIYWLCVGALVCVFGVLLYTHGAQKQFGGWYSGGSSWGDLPLHLTFINYFARQEKVSLVSPIYAQATTTYPFLFDWYTSILFRIGSSMQAAIFVSQLQGMIALLVLALHFIKVVDARSRTALLTYCCFFAGGGFGWWYFMHDWQVSGMQLFDFLQHMPWQYTNMPERNMYFSSVIPDMLLPQRGFAIGLTMVIATASLLLQFVATKSLRYYWLATVLIGLLPLFHMHSFLWAVGLWGLITLYQWLKLPALRTHVLQAGTILIALAGPQLLWFVQQGAGAHFIHWQLGWMLTEGGSRGLLDFMRLYILNFGLIGLTVIVLPILLAKNVHTKPALRIIFGYSWLVFVVCLLVSFQPWAYDNLKLMMPSFFFLCLFTAHIVEDFLHKKQWASLALLGSIVLASTSGGLSVLRELFLSNEIASAQDVAIAADVQKELEPNAVVLTGENHNHLIPMLVGQPIVMGYRGWLWSHGIDASTTARDVALMYAGSAETSTLLKKYTVQYVYISDLERHSLPVNEQYWATQYPLIYQHDNVLIYDVTDSLMVAE